MKSRLKKVGAIMMCVLLIFMTCNTIVFAEQNNNIIIGDINTDTSNETAVSKNCIDSSNSSIIIQNHETYNTETNMISDAENLSLFSSSEPSIEDKKNCHQMIEEWNFNKTIEIDKNLQELLDKYFEYRLNDFYDTPNSIEINATEIVLNDIYKRRTLVQNMQDLMGIKFLDADVAYNIDNVSESNDEIVIELEEWSFYDYDDLADSNEAIDTSGFATNHIITVEKKDDIYKIISDNYSEEDMNSMVSAGYIGVDNLLGTYLEEDFEEDELELMSSYTYSPDAAVAYADTYWQNYNPNYSNYNSIGGDCANFVSQSLYAGGMPMDSTWYWYSYSNRGSAWSLCESQRSYFATKGTLIDNPSNSQVLKGNPVWYYSSSKGRYSHAAICVGKNSAGTPIVDAHNNDRYHVTWTLGNTWSKRSTVQLEAKSGNNPDGYIDSCSGGSGSISVRGWAFDRDDTGVSVPVHVYIGGPAGNSNAEGHAISANVYRSDVNTQFGVGDYHGYDAKINTNKTGTQEVYIYACNAAGGGENVLIEGSPKTVNITPRASILDSWLSESDMGSKVTECEKGKSYYLCYKMYDTNSGEYFNSYSNLSYTVRLTFYDKNGSEIGYRDFTKVDRASVQFTTVEAGTCSYKVTLSGDLSGEVTQSFAIRDTTPQTYKITYNANGGQNAPASQTKTENVDLTLTTSKPTRTGYEFYGWGKTSTSNSASYSSGGTYKDNASITLYAIWVPVQYIVKYNANGGSGSMDTQLHIYDISKNLRTNTFTRTNYTFKNWNTKADGSGVSYSDGASVKNLSATKGATFNLYAIWNGISVTGVNLNKTSLSLKVGGTSTLTATVLPSNATNKTVSWKSSNTSVATVSNGVVTAKAVGTATITAATSDGSKTATCTVTVTSASVAVTSVSLNKTSTTLDVGKTETLTAMVLPSNATNKTVSWTSSNTSVATVSNGVVTAKSAGTATITAKTADGAKTATCTVKVNSPVDENAPKVQVKNVIGKAGNTVDVVLKVENNPGIAVLGFKVGYDSSAMTLQSVTVNDVFSSSDITAGDISKNPYTISAMSASANIKTNGNLVTLTFKIKDNCSNGVYAITLTEPEAYNINEQTVTFTLVNGTVTVKDVEPGDITGDGSINRLDLLRLGKYLADWDVEISEASADVTGDGNVNRLDLLRLGKYLADWDVVLGQ